MHVCFTGICDDARAEERREAYTVESGESGTGDSGYAEIL